jgi:serine beta-lactamase-like protein LACTB
MSYQRTLGLGALALLWILPLRAEAVGLISSSHDYDTAERAHQLLAKELAPKVPGFSAAVAVNGRIVWQECSGYADLENRLEVRPQTRFRIGSISKALTSVGLMRLVESGQINLDVPIQTYIDDFPHKDASITLRLLAGHLSGIRDYKNGEALSVAAFPDTRSRLKTFENDPLLAAPGAAFHYSAYNWDVIELAMERAAGTDFVSYMNTAVLQPMELRSTCVETPETIVADCTRFYEINATGAFVFGPPINVKFGWAKGGFLSTAEDLVRFGSALLHPGVLKQSSLDLLFTQQKTSAGVPTGYGVGWFIYSKPGVIYHSGWTVGGLSILLILPDAKTVVAILTDRGKLNVTEGSPMDFDVEELGFKLARCFAQ